MCWHWPPVWARTVHGVWLLHLGFQVFPFTPSINQLSSFAMMSCHFVFSLWSCFPECPLSGPLASHASMSYFCLIPVWFCFSPDCMDASSLHYFEWRPFSNLNITVQNILSISTKAWSLFLVECCLYQVLGETSKNLLLAINYILTYSFQFDFLSCCRRSS